MKVLKYLILVFLCTFLMAGLKGQDYLYFSGNVAEYGTGIPVTNYPIIITEGDSLALSLAITDQEGYYFDSVPVNPSGYEGGITVSTPDCEGYVQSVNFDPPDSLNIANFEICVYYDSCQAIFAYDTLGDEYTYQFTDYSTGQFTSWAWDFGDGTFSGEQNPVHQFNSTGYFEVCLTVSDSMQSCFSTWCEVIFVGEQDCAADFEWEADPDNELRVHFTDESSGNIAFWFWDFGDGQDSDEQSPSHTYTEPGVYLVTLVIFDSLEFCSSIFQDWVVVDISFECEASFISELDTINNTPFVYHFENTSIGNYSNVFWDFGDGNYSEEESPTHTYEDGGTYEVCLQIFSQDSSGCQDDYCSTITTPAYYDFGGHAFLGNFPMNVEVDDSSNMAVASLFRRVDNRWEFMDKRAFWKFGYYWFTDKPEGEYIIRVDLLPASDDFGYYSPTYLPDIRFWENAETFTLSDSEEFAVDIYLKELAERSSGIGEINGTVLTNEGCLSGVEVALQLVYLLNNENQIIDYTYSDIDGKFVFSGLAYGNYFVRAEIPGKGSEFISVSIGENNPIQTGIDPEIYCNSFVGIDVTPSKAAFTISSIYPLPAEGMIHVDIMSPEASQLNYKIYNINGGEVSEGLLSKSTGKQSLDIDLKGMSAGLYLLRVIDVKTSFSATRKIIIK